MRVIAEDLQFPEGPVWLGDGSVVVVEIRRRTLTQCWPDGRKRIVAELGGGPNGAALGPDGAIYVCNNGGFKWSARPDGSFATAGQPDDYSGGRIQRVDLASGRFETLYDKIGTTPIRGPNDLVFDAHGGFYFTDPGKTRHHDADRGRVAYARADGSAIQELVFPISRPNGIGLSPDGKTLYVAETETARVWAFDLAGPGKLANPVAASNHSPHGGRLIYASPRYQRFDSLKVEANGNVCVGTLDAGCVTVCSPAGGLVESVPVPLDTHVTNLCFGGPDLRTTYLTLSYKGVLAETPWPRPGLKLNDGRP